MKTDEYYMHLALKEAEKSAQMDEVPIGAVLVENNHVLARGHNMKEKKKDPTCHAEIEVIRKACKKKASWRLENATLYVTIEPCMMCAGTMVWSRVRRIVYGAKDPKGGAMGSSFSLLEVKRLNHYPEITGGVLEEECAQIMKDYFQKKRKLSKNK